MTQQKSFFLPFFDIGQLCKRSRCRSGRWSALPSCSTARGRGDALLSLVRFQRTKVGQVLEDQIGFQTTKSGSRRRKTSLRTSFSRDAGGGHRLSKAQLVVASSSSVRIDNSEEEEEDHTTNTTAPSQHITSNNISLRTCYKCGNWAASFSVIKVCTVSQMRIRECCEHQTVVANLYQPVQPHAHVTVVENVYAGNQTFSVFLPPPNLDNLYHFFERQKRRFKQHSK